MRLQEIKKIFHKELDHLYSSEEVGSFFYILLEHYLGMERFILVLQPQLTISKVQEQPLFEALAQLKLERPIQYIIGETTFMDLPLFVNEKVLIPRPETEELVQWVLDDTRSAIYEVRSKKGKKPPANPELTILDIGTGSGCIAISLAKYLPGATIYALDTSEEILELANANANRNGVKVEGILGDIFKLKSAGVKFDIVVSNPPYVRESEKEAMNTNVKKYEPAAALYVTDQAPLVFYEKIIRFASENLIEGGGLFLEINQYLGRETCALLENQNFSQIELRKDMFGNDRMLKGVYFG